MWNEENERTKVEKIHQEAKSVSSRKSKRDKKAQ
jgi:hypothetical protein